MRIYLADLGHNQLTISSDVFPLGVSNLATYTKAYANLHEELDIRIFREPQALKSALDAQLPDVLGLSSYSWNHELALAFARYAKNRSPDILTLMGGPNFPLTRAEQETYLRGIPEIDVAVRGPTYEGERAFMHLVRRFSETNHSLEGLQEEPVPANLWIHRRTGEFVAGAEIERIHDLDEIPSPYLAGIMDPFFATGLFPLLTINRGCPFSCTFCNSSVKSNSKIYRHSINNVKDDLLYIAKHVRPEITLCFADDNFGMYAWDEEVADFLGGLQDSYGWPRYIRTTTGKNNHERIIRVMRKTHGVLPLTAAVQSLNPEVLANIKRSNIKVEAYGEITKELQSRGMQSYGELILCLPGETKVSFMKSVESLMDAGVKRISAHQLMLLHGAPLNNPESRQQFGFKTRFRVVARDIGNYLGEPVVEVEEIVVETPTFSFADYLETRVFHLLLTIYYYEGNFEEAFEFARQGGVKPFELIVKMQSLLAQAPPAFKTIIEDFVRESQEEIFQSREACINWARRNFEALVGGTAGGNLLSKYSMLGRFFVNDEAVNFLETGIEAALGESAIQHKQESLKTVMNYLRLVLLRAPFADNLAATPNWVTWYDIEAWRQEGYSRALEAHRYAEPHTFAMTVEPPRKAVIESRLATFGEHPSGMGKFTRTMFARDLHRTAVALAAF